MKIGGGGLSSVLDGSIGDVGRKSPRSARPFRFQGTFERKIRFRFRKRPEVGKNTASATSPKKGHKHLVIDRLAPAKPVFTDPRRQIAKGGQGRDETTWQRGRRSGSLGLGIPFFIELSADRPKKLSFTFTPSGEY